MHQLSALSVVIGMTQLLLGASLQGRVPQSVTSSSLSFPLSIDPSQISISGLSSGADFTVQFQVAYSELIMGSGVFAGQPYHCAVTRFDNESEQPQCVQPRCTVDHPAPSVPICDRCDPGMTLRYDHCKIHVPIVQVSRLADFIRASAASGEIDAVSNLARARIYLYRGTKDAIYGKGSVQNVADMYEAVGVPKSQILFNNTTPSAHCWPTPSYGPHCGSGVIEACAYDGPGAALMHIYDSTLLRPTNLSSFPHENLVSFDQRPYFSDDNNGTAAWNETTPRATGLAPSAMLFVPTKCRATGANCKLHVSLHGCSVNEYYDEAVQHLGLEAWGELNNIVVLYPRIQPHGGTIQTQDGCWDAYGQTGADYAFKSGVQMAAVRAMIKTLAGV